MIKEVAKRIRDCKHIYMLTGAGISAPSKVPTFRGTDGMWTNMQAKGMEPTELLTCSTFDVNPKFLWNWFVDFKAIMDRAQPNPAHLAILKLQEHCKTHGKEFTLVTQNIDNYHSLLVRQSKILHPRVVDKEGDREFGFTEGVMEIHGNANYMRCSSDRHSGIYRYPEGLQRDCVPVCPKCGSPMRPHVLLFDECYRQDFYKSNTASFRSENCDCMFVIGSELLTNLPRSIAYSHVSAGKLTVEINPRKVIDYTGNNLVHISESCDKSIPKLIDAILDI